MTTDTLNNIDLKTIVDDFFLVLTEKEKEVITRRFSLNNKPKQTLERIGQHFKVTRERIRQIENIALLKLRRHISNSQLVVINSIVKKILEIHGWVFKEDSLISEALNTLKKDSTLDWSIVKLALAIDEELTKNDNSNIFNTAWRFDAISMYDIKVINDNAVKILKKKGHVLKFSEIYTQIQKLDLFEDKRATPEFIKSCIEINKDIRATEEWFGLMEWRSINPRSIKDKAIIALKNNKKPMHFVELTNAIADIGLRKKSVTTQAVHNELIRYADFVLVGRGLYALKEWGYQEGTVSDVIEKILKEKGPLKKQEIIKEVQKQREVQLGTISLNLQKNVHFARVGRAVYDWKD